VDDEVLALLRVHEYFRGVGDDALRAVLDAARVRTVAAGEVVHQPEDSVTTVEFVLRGRLKAVKLDAHGRETPFRFVERGDQLGLMLGALREPVPVRVVSLEASAVLELDHDRATELSVAYPDLRKSWLSTYAGSLRAHFFGATTARGPMMLALVHETPASRPTAERLLGRLHDLGEEFAVFGDSPAWQGRPGMRYRPLVEDGRRLGPDDIRRQAAAWQDATRILFDVGVDRPPDEAAKLMQLVDRVVYFAPAAEAAAVADRLRAWDVAARGWRDKVAVAWILEPGRTIAPTVPGLRDLVGQDFKIADNPPGRPWGRAVAAGLERLVHDLRGVRVGVALGGGAARGMSHLGVLAALEKHGVVVDRIAGTSAGAMSGIVYASGLDPTFSAGRFAADLTPSWLFRHLFRGYHWYLLYKYRRGHFDPMLREYLRDWTLEQLPVPCAAVSVDLVSGQPVVRDRGDAVHAILESINLPVLSTPICRNGQALVDGGLINNIPADVLVSMGCNFVIAVSVTAKMEKRFADIRPGAPPPRRRPSTIQTVLRSLLVQNHNLNALGVQPADVVIEPDVTGFDLTEFLRSEELAAVGDAAAAEEVPKIRTLLHRLDPKLFPAVT
jgi:NTE family protein